MNLNWREWGSEGQRICVWCACMSKPLMHSGHNFIQYFFVCMLGRETAWYKLCTFIITRHISNKDYHSVGIIHVKINYYRNFTWKKLAFPSGICFYSSPCQVKQRQVNSNTQHGAWRKMSLTYHSSLWQQKMFILNQRKALSICTMTKKGNWGAENTRDKGIKWALSLFRHA